MTVALLVVVALLANGERRPTRETVERWEHVCGVKPGMLTALMDSSSLTDSRDTLEVQSAGIVSGVDPAAVPALTEPIAELTQRLARLTWAVTALSVLTVVAMVISLVF